METSQLFITRKRKKWKFAHFNEWPNCFQASEVSPKLWREYFGNDAPLVAEVGAGTADLSVELARRNPQQNFVAIDVKSDRLYIGAKVALHEKLPNIAFVRSHLNHIDEMFAPHSLSEIWVTFPDPFPRKRQAKHRLTHPNFLQRYKKALTTDGTLRFKTDNRELFLWSLEQLVVEKWQLRELSFDLHKSELPEDYKITTNYERRFIARDVPINYCAAAYRDSLL